MCLYVLLSVCPPSDLNDNCNYSCSHLSFKRAILIHIIDLLHSLAYDVDVLCLNVAVVNTTLSNTNGTSPAHGVDFEPDTPNQRLTNITFRDCTSINNQGAGYGFDFAGLTAKKWCVASNRMPSSIPPHY